MSRPSIWNAKFDRNQDFVVSKPFRVRGIDLVAGETFDKTMVTTRTLRQLFESRKLKVATIPSSPTTAPAGGLTIQHLGFGRYAVFKGDVRLTPEPLTKAEAEAYAG
jgi:iron only hydrogenase large subunit-like protein